MLPEQSVRCSCAGLPACLTVLLLACQTTAAESATASGSVVLLDFEDDAQFAHLRVRDYTKVEPALQASQGKRAARIVYSAVPEGLRDFPAVIIEGPALRVRDLTPFEAISLSVLNPGPEDAELSLAVWDKDGNRSFPIPSTVAIKPGRWQQVVSRLVLHGLEAKQIGSIHLYQKANRRPVTLFVDDIQLLSPYAGRIAARIQAVRDNLKAARNSAAALGATNQIEPKIAALSRRLEQLADPASTANAASQRTQRLLELARLTTESQELAGSIRIRDGGKNVTLAGSQVEASWLSNQEKVRLLTVLNLSHTRLGDGDFSLLAPAENLGVLILDGKGITGAGLDKLPGEKLRSLFLVNTSAHDKALGHVRKLAKLQEIYLGETSVTSGVLQHFDGLTQLKTLGLDGTEIFEETAADDSSKRAAPVSSTRIGMPGTNC